MTNRRIAKYKVGIIGCGNIFARHLEAIKLNHEKFSLVAVCDVDPKRSAINAQEMNIPGFTDYRQMLKKMKGKMNLVSIATPNAFHFEQAIDALNHGYNILVEKPVDFIHQRLQKIQNLADKKKLNAYAVLQVRYNPTLTMVKEALGQEFLGSVRSISLTQRWQRPETYFDSWRADIKIGGRTLYEVGIHYLDIVQWLFGLPKVTASTSFSNKHKNIPFEDTVFAILKFPSGASGSIEVTIASEPSNLECSISIMGSEGYIKIGGRALDKIETAMFLSPLIAKKWDGLNSKFGQSLEPNSYGAYAGSCPNHPTLYQEIAAGRGIAVHDAINSIKFIEDIYAHETK